MRWSRGGGQGLYATVVSSLACAVVPGQWVAPATWPQAALLVGTGPTPSLPLLSDKIHASTSLGERQCANACFFAT